jgi:hypothetical protein
MHSQTVTPEMLGSFDFGLEEAVLATPLPTISHAADLNSAGKTASNIAVSAGQADLTRTAAADEEKPCRAKSEGESATPRTGGGAAGTGGRFPELSSALLLPTNLQLPKAKEPKDAESGILEMLRTVHRHKAGGGGNGSNGGGDGPDFIFESPSNDLSRDGRPAVLGASRSGSGTSASSLGDLFVDMFGSGSFRSRPNENLDPFESLALDSLNDKQELNNLFGPGPPASPTAPAEAHSTNHPGRSNTIDASPSGGDDDGDDDGCADDETDMSSYIDIIMGGRGAGADGGSGGGGNGSAMRDSHETIAAENFRSRSQTYPLEGQHPREGQHPHQTGDVEATGSVGGPAAPTSTFTSTNSSDSHVGSFESGLSVGAYPVQHHFPQPSISLGSGSGSTAAEHQRATASSSRTSLYPSMDVESGTIAHSASPSTSISNSDPEFNPAGSSAMSPPLPSQPKPAHPLHAPTSRSAAGKPTANALATNGAMLPPEIRTLVEMGFRCVQPHPSCSATPDFFECELPRVEQRQTLLWTKCVVDTCA